MSPRAREAAAPRKKQEKAFVTPVASYVREETRDAGVQPAPVAVERDAGRQEVLPGGVGGPAPVVERATRVGDAIVFDDVFLINDEGFIYERLDALTAEIGAAGVDRFVASFETQIDEEARSAHADESAADVSAGWSENIAIARARASEARVRADVERAILPALQRVHLRLQAENRQFLAEFEQWGNALVRAILAQSDAILDEQLNAYVTATPRTETYMEEVGENKWRQREITVYDYKMKESAATAGLAYSTSELAVKRDEITRLERQRVYEMKRVRGPDAWAMEYVLKRDDALEGAILKGEAEYKELVTKHSREHRILQATHEPLVRLTAQDKITSPQAARAIVDAVAERKGNIQEVRDQIGGRYSIWSQPLILAMTAQLHGVPAGTRQDRLVRDTFKTYKSPRETALSILTAVVLVLGAATAVLTLGGSAVAAAAVAAVIAGIDMAILADAIAQYQVDAAATETDLEPQYSVSQTKPTATEIVFDVVGVLADVVALGAQLKAVGAAGRAASAGARGGAGIVRFGEGGAASVVRLTEQELAVLQKEGMAGFAGAEGRLARTAGPTYLVRIGKAGEGAGFSRWGFGIFKDEAAAAAYAKWLSSQPEEVLRRITAIPEMWNPANRSAFETIKVWKLPEGGVAYIGGRVAPQLEAAKVFADVSAAKTAEELLEAGRLAREAPVAGGGSQVLLLSDVKGAAQVGSELPVLAASGKAAIADPRVALPVVKAVVTETKSAVVSETKSVAATEAKAAATETKSAATEAKAASTEPEWFTKPDEIHVTRAQYERALAHGYVPQAFSELASAIHEIGERAAFVVTQNPRFVQAVNNGDWKLAGTLFHSEAARQGPIVAQSLGPSFQMRFTMHFEEELAGGASRLDILAQTPSGLVEVDWKTTGRSGLSWKVRTDEMPRHAAHVVLDHGVPLSEQLSKSWVDYVRPYMPGVKWPK